MNSAHTGRRHAGVTGMVVRGIEYPSTVYVHYCQWLHVR
jgi:hypothetical protein